MKIVNNLLKLYSWQAVGLPTFYHVNNARDVNFENYVDKVLFS